MKKLRTIGTDATFYLPEQIACLILWFQSQKESDSAKEMFLAASGAYNKHHASSSSYLDYRKTTIFQYDSYNVAIVSGRPIIERRAAIMGEVVIEPLEDVQYLDLQFKAAL